MILPYCPHVDARERDSAWRAAARLCAPAQRWELARLLECPWRVPFRSVGARVAAQQRLAGQYRQARLARHARDSLRDARLMLEGWHRDGGGVPR